MKPSNILTSGFNCKYYKIKSVLLSFSAAIPALFLILENSEAVETTANTPTTAQDGVSSPQCGLTALQSLLLAFHPFCLIAWYQLQQHMNEQSDSKLIAAVLFLQGAKTFAVRADDMHDFLKPVKSWDLSRPLKPRSPFVPVKPRAPGCPLAPSSPFWPATHKDRNYYKIKQ